MNAVWLDRDSCLFGMLCRFPTRESRCWSVNEELAMVNAELQTTVAVPRRFLWKSRPSVLLM